MRHGRKVAGEPTKKSYEAPAGDNTSERGEVCVYPSWACLCVCVSVLRALVACKKVRLQKSFRSIVIVHHAADRKLQRETKPHGCLLYTSDAADE